MIQHLRIENYKAISDVTVQLTPLHVLIGPNDSGKTSILEAAQAICRSVDFPLAESFVRPWRGRELVRHGAAEPVITLHARLQIQSRSYDYSLGVIFPSVERVARGTTKSLEYVRSLAPAEGEPVGHGYAASTPGFSGVWYGSHLDPSQLDAQDAAQPWSAKSIHSALSGVQYYKWEPTFLALPTAADSSRKFRMESTGFGLASCLDDILGFDREKFGQIENQLRRFFPSIRSIKLIVQPAFQASNDVMKSAKNVDGKGLYFQFMDASTLVPAAQVSDGLLLVLAYLTILHLPDPPHLLLIEEPENGIHPKRLGDLVGVLREMINGQSETQIILTTHSPYVLDYFQPAEVTLCKRDLDGTVAVTRLSDSQVVRKRMDVFSLGEIWSAEGEDALAHTVAAE